MNASKTLLFIAFCFYSFFALSQDDRNWKKELKKLSPDEYQKLVEAKEQLESKNSELENEISSLENQLSEKESTITQLEEKLATAGSPGTEESAEPQADGLGTIQEEPTAKKAEPIDGLVYKVQIGAFKDKDLTEYISTHKNFSVEVGEDGMKKYTLGVFKEYWEADKFKKYLREMGVKDAWIVAYKDGQRVDIKDALEGVI